MEENYHFFSKYVCSCISYLWIAAVVLPVPAEDVQLVLVQAGRLGGLGHHRRLWGHVMWVQHVRIHRSAPRIPIWVDVRATPWAPVVRSSA